MFKQTVIMTIITIAVIYFAKEITPILHWILNIQGILAIKISSFFPTMHAARLIANIITLIIIPIIIGLIPSFFYWILKHEKLPSTPQIIMLSWMILLVTFMLYK